MAEKQLGSSVKQKPSQCTRLLVAAIDFGTVYSGYAYSFKAEWPTVMTNTWCGGEFLSYKTPSALLLNPDQSFNSFGFDAEREYASLTEYDKDSEKYFFFQRFKMILKSSMEKRVHRKTQCTAENGISIDAMKVFTHCINYMREHLLKRIKYINYLISASITMDNFYFVLTVPATWDDTAKMFMREAAVQAGINNDQLLITLEPDAALVYCHLMHLESPDNETFLLETECGAKCMVLDLGGTSKITIHQLKEDGTSGELVSANGYGWGGTSIDRAFNKFLTSLFGERVMHIFQTDPEYIEDYFEFWHQFEVKKRAFEKKRNNNKDEHKETYQPEKNVFQIRIPLAIREIVAKLNKQGEMAAVINDAIQQLQYTNDLRFENGKLIMKSSFFEEFFKPTVEILINHLIKLYTEIGKDLKVILMVGFFSECSVIQEAVKKEFEGKCRVVVPNQAGLAVVKGAVYFGHQPDLITERVSRYTYGIETWPAFNETKHDKSKRVVMDDVPRCKDVFFKFFSKGDIIKPGDKKSYIFKSFRPNAKALDCGVFISNKKNPKYVDDEGCAKLGTLTIPLDGVDRNVYIKESLIFGDTELYVTACNCINKMFLAHLNQRLK
eukprot:XP_011431527.2 PREDICTED: heat shock 70 kDa protein 12A [Crassostrea gigas]